MRKTCVSALAAVAIGCATTASAIAQPDTGDRTIDQYTCKDILRESGAPREVAVAFMHGYLLAKSGATKFNIEALLKQTDAFIDRCLTNTSEKAIDAMTKVKQ